MLKWQSRLALNSIKACVPFQAPLRKLKHAAAPPAPGEHHELLVDGILEQIALIRAAGGRIEGSRVLEIGSGWIPVAPLIYRLAGARQVVLSDQHELLHPRALEAAAAFLRQRSERLARELGTSRARVEDLLDPKGARTRPEMLEALGLDYLVPLDPATLTGTIDLAYSHTVLEHVPPAALEEIFALVRARLAPGGLFCNGIDNSDHRRAYDPRLSIVDFLRYSEFAWKLQCINPQDYTNRLRHSDYLALLDRAGFDRLEERVHVARGEMEELEGWNLPARFDGRDAEDLCTTWSLILARA